MSEDARTGFRAPVDGALDYGELWDFGFMPGWPWAKKLEHELKASSEMTAHV